LLSEDGWTALKAGVIKGEKPYFFQVEYVNNTGNPPLILDIEEIDCDTFLDFINAKQILK
tara:strand:+ start:2125 stop:2304 length:180 start_codon:yes stop_codon:yes gene_type:complete